MPTEAFQRVRAGRPSRYGGKDLVSEAGIPWPGEFVHRLAPADLAAFIEASKTGGAA